MVQDLVHNLCESLVENIDGVTGIGKKTPPTPITYLTQWKIVGNSEVHGVGNLTSWKVSGNSIVQDGAIMSCGDLGQDGKYHVKISNGVTIYDIPLTEPLRKVNDVADTIEFPSGTEGKALVTRNFSKANLGNFVWLSRSTNQTGKNRFSTLLNIEVLPNCIGSTINGSTAAIALCSKYNVTIPRDTYNGVEGIGIFDISYLTDGQIFIYDSNADTLTPSDFKNYIQGVELIYQITPTTELVDVSQFPVSVTDTYTSANVVPYSAFEHTENKEIWSCGEYNATDGKYHILVQPQGGSIADIALTEPLRKVNDVADTIEFPSDTEGKALVTRFLKSILIGNINPTPATTITSGKVRWKIARDAKNATNTNILGNVLSNKFSTISSGSQYSNVEGICINNSNNLVMVYDDEYSANTDSEAFKAANADVEVIYELATPTTELIDAPQIEESESYSMVISQGGKAVSWSSFEIE